MRYAISNVVCQDFQYTAVFRAILKLKDFFWFDLDGNPACLGDAGVFAGQSCHFARPVDREDVSLDINTIVRTEKVRGEANPGLDSAGAIIVKPDTDLLRLQLLLRG